MNLTINVSESCACETDAVLEIFIKGLRSDLQNVITTATSLSTLQPERRLTGGTLDLNRKVLIEALDSRAVSALYGVAAAFVLKNGNTFEIASLYPFTSVSYDPMGSSSYSNDGKIVLLFRKGLADMSTSGFGPGDTKSIMFYLGSTSIQETTDTAFIAFASDVEAAYPTRNFAKPFIAYGLDYKTWNSVRQEAESHGYSFVYSSTSGAYTSNPGGGHYFGLGWGNLERLKNAGLESSLVQARDGSPIGDGVAYRVNPSSPEVQSWIRNQIKMNSEKRDWFIADGADIVQDFNPQHSNALEGYVQAILYARSCGKPIIYNAFHKPRLWLDWAADGVEIEAPTGLYTFGGNGQRVDFLSSGEFAVTREFLRLHMRLFPGRLTVWHDYVSLEDSSSSDSIALFLVEGADGFSFSTNPSGDANVKPGEITTLLSRLSSMQSIAQLSLGSVIARGFTCGERSRSCTFEALTSGIISWHGSVDKVLIDGVIADTASENGYATFYVQTQSQVTILAGA